MINLIDELQKAFDGDAWHGNNTMSLLRSANPNKVFTHPITGAHSIAELVLHLTAWTEEVIARLNGAVANEPSRGDWPVPTQQSQTEWELMVSDFEKVNQKLISFIGNFDLSRWSSNTNDERNRSLGTGVNNAQLLNGLIQHHAYHSGQIALLLKF